MSLGGSLRSWRPGTVELTRRVDPWPVEAFAGLIGARPPAPGVALPPLWHWFTLLDHPAQADLGPDGHPADGPLLPPIPGRRRMFAGGRLRLDAPITIGADLSSRSRVAGVSVKSGRSGELAFVTVRHELSVDGAPAGVEEQDIVYRAEPAAASPAGTPPAAAPPRAGAPAPDGPWRVEVATDPVLLFRFSALTYNGHRIHYDRPYATQVEDYPDLVVHGPLLALIALELPRIHAADRTVRAVEYRLARPAFAPSRIIGTGRLDGSSVRATVAAAGAEPSLTARIDLT